MTSIFKTDAELFADGLGLTSSDIGSKSIERPGVKYNLTLKLTRSGKQILITNGGDIALLKSGDRLKMNNFNRFVKRAFKLESKGTALVTVTTNNKGMYGVRHQDRFLPFNAFRGYASFTVVSLVEKANVQKDQFTTI